MLIVEVKRMDWLYVINIGCLKRVLVHPFLIPSVFVNLNVFKCSATTKFDAHPAITS